MNTHHLMATVEAVVCNRPGEIERTLSLRISEAIAKEAAAGVEIAYRRCGSHVAKLALRQRSKARPWARHHMRNAAKELPCK